MMEQCTALSTLQPNTYRRGLRVFADVIQRFLNHPVEGGFHRGGWALRKEDAPKVQPRALGHSFGKKFNRRNQSQVVQDGGAKLMGKMPKLKFNIVEQTFHLPKPAFAAGIELACSN